MNGFVVVHKRKGPSIILFMCNYIKTPRGNIYFVKDDYDRSLTIFSGHFFDRLNERIFKKKLVTDMNREDLIASALVKLQISSYHIDRDALLVDEETGEAFNVFQDGYGAGDYIDVEVDKKHFPRNETGKLRVSFLKTFLTDEEISPMKMEKLVELYRNSPRKDYATIEEIGDAND
jgi:hypothetical protein